MKLKELINRVDVKKVISEDTYNWGIESLFKEFRIDLDVNYDKADFQNRLFSGHIAAHYCTDDLVGLKVYVFDRRVVAFSNKTDRKSDELFFWVSKEDYRKVKEFCYSFIEKEQHDDIALISECNSDIDSEGYRIEFSGQLLRLNFHSLAEFEGEQVNVLKDSDPRNPISKNVFVRTQDGNIIDVSVRKLKFPYKLLK